MNIRIYAPIDESLVLETLPFGSRVYGTATDRSDYDYIKILKKSTGDFILQYKDTKVDYVYVGDSEFTVLSTEGGNVPMFEAGVAAGKFTIDDIDVYAVCKAYLGLVKRDLDYGQERMKHVHRGLRIFTELSQGKLPDLRNLPDYSLPTDIDNLKAFVKLLRKQLNIDHKKV